jgi:hypothetical protein
MKRTRLATAVLALIAVPALALSLSAASSQASSTAQASPKPGTRPVVIDCLGKGNVEPATFVLTCADGNSYLTRLHWTTWNSEVATATGTLMENDCVPYCAAGHFHSYPAVIVLWEPEQYAAVRRFTEMTQILPGARPFAYNRHGKKVPAQRVGTGPLRAPKI